MLLCWEATECIYLNTAPRYTCTSTKFDYFVVLVLKLKLKVLQCSLILNSDTRINLFYSPSLIMGNWAEKKSMV